MGKCSLCAALDEKQEELQARGGGAPTKLLYERRQFRQTSTILNQGGRKHLEARTEQIQDRIFQNGEKHGVEGSSDLAGTAFQAVWPDNRGTEISQGACMDDLFGPTGEQSFPSMYFQPGSTCFTSFIIWQPGWEMAVVEIMWFYTH